MLSNMARTFYILKLLKLLKLTNLNSDLKLSVQKTWLFAPWKLKAAVYSFSVYIDQWHPTQKRHLIHVFFFSRTWAALFNWN